MRLTFPSIRLLYFTREEFPTHRVDVDILFGRELIGRGHAIDFVMQAASAQQSVGVCEWRGRKVFVGRTAGGHTVFRPFVKKFLGLWHDMRSLALISPARYDAVQVRDKFLVGVIALAVARIRGVRFFFWLSFPIPEDDILRAREGKARMRALVYLRGMLCGWLLYRWILPRCDHAFVQSRRMSDDVAAHGIERSKLTAVPMGIAATDVVRSVASDCRDDPSKPVTLVYLGVFNAQRRLTVLVDMLALLRRHGLDATLLFVGDGDSARDRVQLESYAEQLGVRDRVEITGFMSRADALRRIEHADVALSPFFPTPVLLSTSPTKLVEYLALGLPVVANDHPEQSLVLRESRAGVCVPWGGRHFARAVRWLMNQSVERRRAMGERGKMWVQANRTYEKIADDLECKYAQLLGSQPMRG